MNEHIHEIPCDSCAHNRVCTVRKCFVETEIKTTHPYIKVTLECMEYMKIVPTPRKLDAPTIIEAEVITRGKCMMCGKELTEGLFFCKECGAKIESENK